MSSALPAPVAAAESPQDRLAVFMQQPEEARADAERWDRQFRTLPMSTLLASDQTRIAQALGTSTRTVRRRFRTWWANGQDAMALIDRRQAPAMQARGISTETVEFFASLCHQNGRKSKPAWREFERRFLGGDPIPGIPADLPRTKPMPRGLSYGSLLRRARLSQFQLTAARIGRSAAAQYRPKPLTTRVGMSVGQRYVFDDLWHDFEVAVIGQRKPVRLLQLHAHDLFSGCQFARGIKPRIEDPETGRSVGLNAGEMLFLLSHVLGSFGYRPTGCILMVEHGTAAIDERTETLLVDLSGGAITVERSKIEGAAAFAGMYAGRPKGNFRFKACLESLGNLIHNETSGLLEFPGQTGSNSRINVPEELHGRRRLLDALERAMVALPVSVVQLLRRPFVEAAKARMAVDLVMERINQRTDHELEGWIEAGLTTVDFDMPGVGLIPGPKVELLGDVQRAAIAAAAAPVARRLSPREVFDGGKRDLVRLRPEAVARLLHDRHGREVVVRPDHLIAFEDADVSPEPLRYLAHHYSPGDKFRAVVNPFAPEQAHLFGARGQWLGVVAAWQRVMRDDTAALAEQMREAARIEAELLRPLVRRGDAITRKRLADTKSWIEALGGHEAAQEALGTAADDALSNL